MTRIVTNRLDTGCALDADGKTNLWTAKAATSSVPSGTAEASTFNTQGVAWVTFDLVATDAAVGITVWTYRAAVGRWSIADRFKFNGVWTVPLASGGGAGSWDAGFACLGADYVHVQVTDVTGGGNITVDATLSQEV
jgi:hypothetical protein